MTSNVYDRGPREHAMGTVSGSYYSVAAGDTFYSIGLRFGLPYQEITKANGLADDAWVTAGTLLLIPGLAPIPPVKPPPGQARLGINSPTYGSIVNIYSPLSVSGIASDLLSNKIVVRVKDQQGTAVATIESMHDGAGNWQVTFSPGLALTPNTQGNIEAEAPSNNMRVGIMVHYRA